MYRIFEGIDMPEADKQYKSVVYKLAQLDYPSDAVLSPSAARRCKGACSYAANLNRKHIRIFCVFLLTQSTAELR